MSYRYSAVEGNIGAGKTTLASLLATHFNGRLVLEAFADNNSLPIFFRRSGTVCFPFGTFVFGRSLQAITIHHHQYLKQETTVTVIVNMEQIDFLNNPRKFLHLMHFINDLPNSGTIYYG